MLRQNFPETYSEKSQPATTGRTTNLQTINRQFKRRTRGMDTMVEATLESVLASTALKIELGWGLHRIDSKLYTRHLEKEEKNTIENAIEEIGLLN